MSNWYTHSAILKCQMWLQVMERPLILLHFSSIFIHFWQPFISELLYIHQTFTDCISNQYWYVKMSDVSDETANYGMPTNFITFFFKEFCIKLIINVWSIVPFIKLSEIVYLINTHTLICWYARCNYKLWKILWFY